MDILVNVANQKLKIATNLKSIVAGSQEFVRFVFNTDGDWDGLAVFAQFTQDGVPYNQYLDEDNSVFLPAEIGAGTCTVVLYGTGGNTIATTNYVTLTIDENIFVSDANSTEISRSLYSQMVSKVNDLCTDIGIRFSTMEDVINSKASQTHVDTLAGEVNRLKNNEVVVERIEESVKEEISKYLANGKLAAMTIQDGSIGREKVSSDFDETLQRAEDSMQPNIYDPQGYNVDIFAYIHREIDNTTSMANSYAMIAGTRLANLEAAAQGKLYREEVNSNEAYRKAIPSGSLPYAAITSVDTKTMPWNQLIKTEWIPSSTGTLTRSAVNGVTTITGSKTGSYKIALSNFVTAVIGHKYYFQVEVLNKGEGTTGNFYIVENDSMSSSGGTAITSGTKSSFNTVFTSSKKYFYLGTNTASGIYYDNMMLKIRAVDLTDIFGDGKEPDKVSDPLIGEIKSILELLPQEDAGSELNIVPTEIISNGANLLDANLDEGYYISPTTGERNVSDDSVKYKSSSYQNVESLRGKTITDSMVNKNNVATGVAFYTEQSEDSYISGFAGNQGVSYVVPKNASYARWTFLIEDQQPMVVIGDTVPSTALAHREPIHYQITTMPMYIAVENYGNLTFENDKAIQVSLPSSVTYAINVQEAISNE